MVHFQACVKQKKMSVTRTVHRDAPLNTIEYPSNAHFLIQSIDAPTPNEYSDVIIRMSFKDFHLHKILLSRSSVFRTMFSRVWQQGDPSNGMVDGKLLIDLSGVEREMVDGEMVNPDVFKQVLHFLYADEFVIPEMYKSLLLKEEETMQPKKDEEEPQAKKKKYETAKPDATIQYLTQLALLGQYFDLKQLLKMAENSMSDIYKLIFIEKWRTIEEYDVIQYAGSRFGSYGMNQLKDVPLEFVEKLCAHPAFPFSEKIRMVMDHCYENYGGTMDHYKNIQIVLQETVNNSLIKGVSGMDEEEYQDLALQFPSEFTISKSSCEISTGYLFVGCSNSSSHKLFENLCINVKSYCLEDVNRQVWNIEVENNLKEAEGFIYVSYKIGENQQGEKWLGLNEEFSLSAKDIDPWNNMGNKISFIAYVEPRNRQV